MLPYARPDHTATDPVLHVTVSRDPNPVVFIIEGDAAERWKLMSWAQDAGWATEIFGTAAAFLEAPAPEGPSCVVLGAGVPDSGGLELQALLVPERREIPIIVLTKCADVPLTVRAMKAGASAVLAEPLKGAELLDAIGEAIAQSQRRLRDQAALRDLRGRYDSLRPREREVLALVVKGRLNKQIAFELGLREITIKVHRSRMMAKMQARSVIDLIRLTDRLCVAGVLPADGGEVDDRGERKPIDGWIYPRSIAARPPGLY